MPVQPYKLIRSKRRTISLMIAADARLIVRAPLRVSQDYIEELISKKSRWIDKHITRVSARPQPTPISKELLSSYKTQAKKILLERTKIYAHQFNLEYQSVKISSAKRRWGSCSYRGSLNFSWRLVLAPLWVIDYVVAHELSHLQHRNHSFRFWTHVEMMCPDFRKAKLWLKENATLLNM